MGPSILILEDDVVLRRNLGRMFVAHGYEVVETDSVEDFLRAAMARAYDALLMDLWLPDGNGLDAWERVRPTQDGAVAVLMSGQATSDAETRARRLGCARMLTKPLDVPLLMAAYAPLAARGA